MLSPFPRGSLFAPHIGEHRLEKTSAPDFGIKEHESTTNSNIQKDMDMNMFQMIFTAVRMANESNPITINNISAAKAEASHSGSSNDNNLSMQRPTMEIISDMFKMFFSSGFNRVCFFGACGMGIYIYWSYLDHKWHMAEVQRRIDSNIVLRATQWLFDSPVVKREVPSSSFRFLPSFW